MLSKKYAEASVLFEKALSEGARRGDQRRWLPLAGKCYEMEGLFQKALAAYQKAYQLQPKKMERCSDLARIYAKVDLRDQAAELYQKILKKYPRDKGTLLQLADLYEKLHKPDEAEGYLRQYLVLEPQDLVAQDHLSRLEEQQGYWRESARRLETVMAQRPSSEGYVRLGRLWFLLGELELSTNAFRKADNLGATSPSVLFYQALIAWRQHDLSLASVRWEKLRNGTGNKDMVPFFLGLVSLERGEKAEADRFFQDVLSLTDSDLLKSMSEHVRQVISSPGDVVPSGKNGSVPK